LARPQEIRVLLLELPDGLGCLQCPNPTLH
jgi:hypothetical protein